ncbi:NADH-quinone oxidoreductase subunit G [compost metagenome]
MYKNGQWLVVPIHHIFGTEELSSFSEPLLGLIPAPYLAINNNDLKELGITIDDKVIITINNKDYELPVQVKPGLPAKTVGIPYGLKDLVINPFPTTCLLRKK